MSRFLLGRLGSGLAVLAALTTASHAQVLAGDGSVDIAGQVMRCADEPVTLDPDLPSEGMYAPGEGIFLNPELLGFNPPVIRKFVFAHECAHRIVGGDELAADCAAARQGARERWLTAGGVAAICQDFDGQPGSEEHPPGDERCANVRRCFASVVPDAPEVATRTSAWPPKRQAFGSGASTIDKLKRAATAWKSAHP